MNGVKKTILIGSGLIMGAYSFFTGYESNKLSKPLEPLRTEFEKNIDEGKSVDDIVAAKNQYALDNGAMPIEWRVSPKKTPGPISINPARWGKNINSSAIEKYLQNKNSNPTYFMSPSELKMTQSFWETIESRINERNNLLQEEWRNNQILNKYK